MPTTTKLEPYSVAYADAAGRSYPTEYVGASNSRREEMIGVLASLAGDSAVHVMFKLPDTLAATPNATLLLEARANAAAGSGVLDVGYAAVAAAANPDTASLTSVTGNTVTWAAADNDKLKESTVSLAGLVQADAGKYLVIVLTFKTATWSLAAASGWRVRLAIDVA